MSLTSALRLAYASAGPAAAMLDTIELAHPDWPAVVRLVGDRANLTATLESDAPNDPGASVTFTAFPLALTVPRTGDGPQDITVTISNANRLLMPALEATDFGAGAAITAIWRPFVTSDLTQPGMRVLLAVKSFAASVRSVSLSCGVIDFANRRFSRAVYKDTEFPGLAERI